jgi:tetratricopeptide (TPR) repeat protein
VGCPRVTGSDVSSSYICGEDGSLEARHRVIAEIIREELQKNGQMRPVVSGLALVAATKVTERMSRSERPYRILRSVINHEFLKRNIGVDGAQNLYGSLESLLNWDFQFWLQRGALEVEMGELALAEQFLNQARSLNSDDPYILNEWAYLLFSKALQNPKGGAAPKLVDEATEILNGLVNRYKTSNPYPYHVLANQGLSWARRGIVDSTEKQAYLSELLKYVREGARLHPRDAHLKTILAELEREYLSGAVVGTRSS